MPTRIHFQWRIRIAVLRDLFQILGKKCGNRSGLFILIDMAEFMGKYPGCAMTITQIDAIAQCKAGDIWREQSRLGCHFDQLRISRARNPRYLQQANVLRIRHPGRTGEIDLAGIKRHAVAQNQLGLLLCP